MPWPGLQKISCLMARGVHLRPCIIMTAYFARLAAMIALSYRGRRGHDKVQIENGKLALERIVGGATQGLQSDPNGATVGFEMIAPTLAAEAEKLGIIKSQGDRILGRLSKLARKEALPISKTI